MTFVLQTPRELRFKVVLLLLPIETEPPDTTEFVVNAAKLLSIKRELAEFIATELSLNTLLLPP